MTNKEALGFKWLTDDEIYLKICCTLEQRKICDTRTDKQCIDMTCRECITKWLYEEAKEENKKGE